MNKKVFIITAIILILAILGVGVYLWIVNQPSNNEYEIEPEEEISDEQMRNTIVTLYYVNKETKELMPEGRLLDAKDLLSNPYLTLVQFLLEQPKNEKLQTTIPEGTKILGAELKGNIVYVNVSKEFIENHEGGKEAESNTINTILNTLTQLNEVNGIKILVNGQENQAFKDNQIKFDTVFTRTQNTNAEQEQKDVQNQINNKEENKT